jgi:hypothetical protein
VKHGKCCEQQAITALSQNPYNAICCRCKEHWFGEPANPKQFTRTEWDALMGSDEVFFAAFPNRKNGGDYSSGDAQ